MEARIHAIQYRVDQTEQPTKHVTDQRAQKEYIERMKIIISGLSSSMLSENEQKIFGNLPTIKAVSKLVAASKQSPINDAILSDVINNFHEFNSISESTSRKIAVIHSCSRLDPGQKMNIISDIDDALSMLDSLYSNLNSINSNKNVSSSIKTELFTQITASKELSDIDKAINHKLKGSIKNYVSLDFLKYRCDNLVQTVSAQKTVSDQNSNNVIDEESSKIVLEGIQDIIEKTQFKTGLLGGDTIRFKDDSSGKTKKKCRS